MMTNPTGRLTQGQFSFLPDLTDAEITLQIEYGLKKGYAWAVEYTDDPHPRNTYWEMFGMPMFEQHVPAALHPAGGVRFDARRRDHRDELHRQPSHGRAGLQRGAAGDERADDPLHDPRARSGPAGRRAVPQVTSG